MGVPRESPTAIAVVSLGCTTKVLVVGPTVTPTVPSSVELALSLITGDEFKMGALKGMQFVSGSISLVHIDDVCSAQIFLMEKPSAQERYICSPVNTGIPQLAEFLSKRYPQYKVPTKFDDVPATPKLTISSQKLLDCGFSFKYGIEDIYDQAIEYMKTKGLLTC